MPPVLRPGCAAGPPLCWEASGGEIPRCALAAGSLPPAPAVLSRRPRGGARPPRLCRRFRGFGLRWLHPVGAPLRPSVRLSARLGPLLPVCCSPGPRPGASRFPGVPRPGSVVRFAAARPPTSPRAGRGVGGGAPVALPLPPTSPPRRAPHPDPVGSARVRVGSPGLPAAGRSPCPRRPASPAPLGPGGRTDAAGASAVPGVVRPGGVDPGPSPAAAAGAGRGSRRGRGVGWRRSRARRPPPLVSSTRRRRRRRAATLAGRGCAVRWGHPRRGWGGGEAGRPFGRSVGFPGPSSSPLPRLAGPPARAWRPGPPSTPRPLPARPAPRARSPTWLILPVAYACLKD